jgi:hypothetical protein
VDGQEVLGAFPGHFLRKFIGRRGLGVDLFCICELVGVHRRDHAESPALRGEIHAKRHVFALFNFIARGEGGDLFAFQPPSQDGLSILAVIGHRVGLFVREAKEVHPTANRIRDDEASTLGDKGLDLLEILGAVGRLRGTEDEEGGVAVGFRCRSARAFCVTVRPGTRDSAS